MAGAQVVESQSALALNCLEGAHMAAGQIHYMNVITYAGAVRSIVIIAEYSQFIAFSYRNLCHVRHQVVGYAVGVLAYQTALMGADGVEVTQQHHVPLPVGILHIGQHLLQHTLGPAVRVGADAFGALLGDGDYLRIAIDGGAR